MKLSEHFDLSEFRCPCGCRMEEREPYLSNLQTLCRNVLEPLRAIYAKPVKVTSGARCRAYNSSVRGSASNSQHLQGKAADISIAGVTPVQLGAQARKIKACGGIGVYLKSRGYFTHVDIRPRVNGAPSEWRFGK